jgi:hypothetical protein
LARPTLRDERFDECLEALDALGGGAGLSAYLLVDGFGVGVVHWLSFGCVGHLLLLHMKKRGRHLAAARSCLANLLIGSHQPLPIA